MSEEQGTKTEEIAQEARYVEKGLGRFFRFKLKGSTKEETIENYSILAVVIGAVMLSAGIGLTAVSTKGIPVIMAMAGAFISFAAIVALIIVWLIHEWKRG